MKVSIIMNVIDRYTTTNRCVGQAIANMAYPEFEFLVCDNGSSDLRMKTWCENLPNLAYFRDNPENQGNYQMLNQSLLRATGDFLCVIDPDILLPKGWLKALVDTHEALKAHVRPGISGLHCVADPGKEKQIGSAKVMFRRNGIFGTKFWSRVLLEEIGYFCEEYGKYGFGDSDYGIRSRVAGFTNYYLCGKASEHIGHDIGTDTEYRRMKTEHLKKHQPIAGANFKRYKQGEGYYIPAPGRTDV